jgi:hypothetical protein
MAALLIYHMARGVGIMKKRYGPSNKLLGFKREDPMFYYLLPLAQTISYMMDNEDVPILSIKGILGVNLDSFI